MGRFFGNIVELFIRKLWLWLLVVLGFTAVFFLGFQRLNIDENIYSIFPQGEAFDEFNSVLRENKLNKQVLFSISAEEKDQDQVLSELDSIASLLHKRCGALIEDVKVVQESAEEQVMNYHYDKLHCFLDTADYAVIDQKLAPDSIRLAMQRTGERLASVNGFFLRDILTRDPLGIGWTHLQEMNPRQDSSGMVVEDGILYSSDHKRAIFTAVLGFELDDNLSNEKLNVQLADLKADINADEKIDFDFFGTFQIAYENSRQVKEDTFLTMVVSVGLILLLLIFYYRSLVLPLYFVLPAIFAAFGGLGLVGFIHPDISAISIATSAVLLGIVLDYSFHFFTHYKHTGDLVQTVQELSTPMLVGSFTTVAAFAALIFTDSVVLQNFGWISLCTLATAALFTLLLLPPLLHLTRYSGAKNVGFNWKPLFPKWVLRTSIFGIVALTVIFLYNAGNFRFDADLNNLSFHSDELAEKENYFTGIDPRSEKKIHLFVHGSTRQELIERNFALYQKLDKFRSTHGLDELLSLAPYQIPGSIQRATISDWQDFWVPRRDSVLKEVREQAESMDFSATAFLPFERWVYPVEAREVEKLDTALLAQLGLDRLEYKDENGWTAISSVVVQKSDLVALKAEIAGMDGLYIFDIAEMTSQLLETVQDDFNYLLLFSSLLVFLSLLVVYGRLELALFAMLPMVISWIWILGLAALFGIEFNFVNIIVATFIFGLGDDFSIFVTDGLQQAYKTNSKNLSSYKAAIILSALTTIIGTGALYFAVHPAIHSIAIISVVGIGCILIVTMLMQPALYNFFITRRTAKKRSPVTFLGLIYSWFLFGYFFVGCLVLNVLLLLLILLPISKKQKRRGLNFMVSKLAGSTINLGFHVKKRIIHKERLDFSRPSIIVANHSSFLDILLMIMMNPKVIIMVKKWVYYSPVFGFFIRYSGYLFIAEGTEYNMDLIRSRIQDGYSVMIFPEGTRSPDGKMKRFHKGAFYLAQELKLDIQPILIIGAHYVNPKNDFIIKSGSLILKVLPRISADDPMCKERFGKLTHSIQDLMRAEMKIAQQEIETARYLRNRVQYNFLYKGPVLEWYVRIKWMFEEKNFAFYDELIGARKRIVDVGCGYGYLSYFLHYRNAEREIIGFDYDTEKIAVAANGYDKEENLRFLAGDVREYSFEECDAIFFNDVLHYLSWEQQLGVLKNAVAALGKDGLLIIRDGITDLKDRHATTQRTEKYSTKIIGFNRTTEPLSFFSSSDIYNFADANGLHCEMLEQSGKTSNVLFVLKRKE